MGIQKELLAAMPRDKQVGLLHNTFDHMHGPDAAKQREAKRLQDALDELWGKDAREKLSGCEADVGISGIDTPTHGVLAAMGYHVGADGVLENPRRETLKWVALRNVPFVCSPEYMIQWGEPCSERRFTKLENVLGQFMRNVEGRTGYGQAHGDWRSDLEFARIVKTLLGPNLRGANGRQTSGDGAGLMPPWPPGA